MNFESLDLTGAKPVAVPSEKVTVSIDPAVMVDDYARAFVRECYRVHPRLYERVNITDEEMIQYCRYILEQRVACVNDECKDWRVIKNLWIPVFIQYAISLIGRVHIKNRGLILEPVIEKTSSMTLEQALELSGRIGLFEREVQIRLDAMPRSKEGDVDTMSSALIAGYVRSMKEVTHPVSTYVAAFMGFTLQKETAFSVLYRVQYDDLEFIRSALTNNREVMGHGSKD